MSRLRPHLTLFSLTLVPCVSVSANSTEKYQFVSDIFPQLNLASSVVPQSRPVRLGGQNFTKCCVLALNQSLIIQNGTLAYSPNLLLTSEPSNLLTVSDFQDAAQRIFPCGATFDGNRSGAPTVNMPYSWCASTCDGWQISHHDALSQWIGPMVGFILPCVAFTLNIPRSWKITIPNAVWRMNPGRTLQLISYIIQMPMALLLVTTDIFVWLYFCFAFAGPMVLSACYEAYFDQRLLTHLDTVVRGYHQNAASLSEELRAKLLFVPLVGNIRFRTEHRINKQQQQQHQVQLLGAVGQLTKQLGFSHPVTNAYKVKAQLKSLMASQLSFGSAVGAPVVFFVGAFIYTLIDIRSKLGDNDTAHALAFGMWWMVIPLLAVVSGTLLASNNQSTLSAIVDPPPVNHNQPEQDALFRFPMRFMRFRPFGWEVFAPSSEGIFHTVSLWERGMNKRRWFDATVDDYITQRRQQNRMGQDELQEIKRLKAKMKFTPCVPFAVILGSLLLVSVPCLLAFLTSYNTPRVGLSCRSLTHLVYFASQVVQGLVWTGRVKFPGPNRAVRAFQYLMIFIFGTIAWFTSIGGTLMQLIGVYRNCLCKIPVQYWLKTNDPRAYVPLSTDTATAIEKASGFWQATAITATVFLCLCCGFGWWHQRRLRRLFRILVAHIDQHEPLE